MGSTVLSGQNMEHRLGILGSLQAGNRAMRAWAPGAMNPASARLSGSPGFDGFRP